ncbi:MAG TPA: sigma 54-interacting transcriptional regulator [Candidatus Tectomicrobia bacterium]|nr:sigma 54-interacting transcriptional regulator [Candidatus Tectomicrobia bacterium]
MSADVLGSSPALASARDSAWRAAQIGTSVLLMGEPGTGKELFARAIHAASARQHYPFVLVDCAAVSRERLEAELFGAALGLLGDAAQEGGTGKFGLALGGTIFLKEIGALPLDVQAKLFRVLQEGFFIEAGGVPLRVTAGVIASTTRDLEGLAAQGRFRRDLLYRLSVVQLKLPPLRERPQDIPFLAWYYWDQKSRELGRKPQLSSAALRSLESYSWPGNVHELIAVLEQVLRESTKLIIEPGDLPVTVVAGAERYALERALRQAQGNRTKAAKLMGLPRTRLDRKLKAYGLLTKGGGQQIAQNDRPKALDDPPPMLGNSFLSG